MGSSKVVLFDSETQLIVWYCVYCIGLELLAEPSHALEPISHDKFCKRTKWLPVSLLAMGTVRNVFTFEL